MGGFVQSLDPEGYSAKLAREEAAQKDAQVAAEDASREKKKPWEGPGFGEMFVGAEKQGLLPKAVNAVTDFYLKPTPAPQPDWKNPAATDSRVPPQFKLGLYSASTPEEYEERLLNMQEELAFQQNLQNSNLLGKAGAFIGTIAAPEMLLSGGAETLVIGKQIYNMSRLQAAAKSAGVMALSGGLLEGANVVSSETKPWEDILAASVTSGLFGGVLGSTRWGKRMLVGDPLVDREAFKVAEDTLEIVQKEARAAADGTSIYKPGIFSPEFEEGAKAATEARMGTRRKFGDRVKNISMADDVTYNSRSGAASEAMSRLGEVSNHTPDVARHATAAVDAEMYKRQLGEVFSDYLESYHAWAKERGLSMKDTRFNGEGHEMFGREVMMELEHMKRTGQPLSTSPGIRGMADSLVPNFNKTELDILKKAGVTGANTVEDNPFHWHRRWEFEKMIGDKKDFTTLLAKSFVAAHDGKVSQKEAEAIALRLFNKMREKFHESVDPALARHSGDHMDAMENAIKEVLGETDEANTLATLFKGDPKDPTPNYLKDKLNLDFSVEHNGKSLYDYVDTNLGQGLSDRMHQSAGRAAMARQGLADDASWDKLRRRVMDDILANPQAKESIQKDWRKLEIVRRQLLGQATYDKPNSTHNKFIRDLLDLTHLGSMGQMGIAQATELGTLLGEQGLVNVIAGNAQVKAVRKLMAKDPELAKDFACLSWTAAKDHKMMLPNLRTDAGRMATSDDGAALTAFRNTMAEGKRLMNYMSLQNTVMSWERNLWLQSTYIRFFDHASIPKGTIPMKRLKDMGISEELNQRIVDNIRRHGKMYKEEGVKTLGLHKWPEKDLMEFQHAMSRQMNQAIQGNLAGEMPLWATTSMGRVLAQFRNFPLVAWTKQSKRSLLLADPTAFATLGYGAVISTLVHYGRTQADLGNLKSEKARKRYDNAMSPAGVASGMLRYLPQASLAPDLGGMVAGLLGISTPMYRNGSRAEDALRIGNLAASGGYVSNMAKSAQGVVNGVRGEFDASDARAMLSIIPFNNILGVKQIGNHLIDAYKQ